MWRCTALLSRITEVLTRAHRPTWAGRWLVVRREFRLWSHSSSVGRRGQVTATSQVAPARQAAPSTTGKVQGELGTTSPPNPLQRLGGYSDGWPRPLVERKAAPENSARLSLVGTRHSQRAAPREAGQVAAHAGYAPSTGTRPRLGLPGHRARTHPRASGRVRGTEGLRRAAAPARQRA